MIKVVEWLPDNAVATVAKGHIINEDWKKIPSLRRTDRDRPPAGS
jgi:hypothetical protein